ncbi:MAG: hypothetical protein GY707_08065 [Desulfobacteraceae bacterium]|nr:hypothetical protein [Desulfobacteraceae bacterium]
MPTKKKWTQPQIKQIDLIFDKEMSLNCKGSAHASAAHPTCGVMADYQSACWNSKTKQSLFPD